MEEEDFRVQRAKEFAKFPSDLPIFRFLRRCKREHATVFNKLLFFFGEIDIDDKDDRQTMSWCTDNDDLPLIEEAFSLICRHGRLEVRYISDDMIEFRLKWDKDEDIQQVVFNKIIFPDFCILPKHSLDF